MCNDIELFNWWNLINENKMDNKMIRETKYLLFFFFSNKSNNTQIVNPVT